MVGAGQHELGCIIRRRQVLREDAVATRAVGIDESVERITERPQWLHQLGCAAADLCVDQCMAAYTHVHVRAHAHECVGMRACERAYTGACSTSRNTEARTPAQGTLQ